MNSSTIPENILITGASGLLGTMVTSQLSKETSVTPLAGNQQFPGMIKINLLAPDAINILDHINWDAVVHCAAIRNPDKCVENSDIAQQLNVKISGQIAELATKRSARMIHISTDYVFDGTSPPYSEDDPTNPVNLYGETKLAAEHAVRDIYPDSIILRIPALYGEPPLPVRSPMIEEGIDAALSTSPCEHDNSIVRHPTYTGDVAKVISFLLKSDFTGTVHGSAPERSTRYEWAKAIAGILGRDASHILVRNHNGGDKAIRPIDSQLCVDKLASLGAPLPKGYSDVLPELASIKNVIESL